jgi:hypothetical protein
MTSAKETVPENFLCSISGAIFEDPVCTDDGHTYERLQIQEWLDRGNMTSPLTNLRLRSTTLTPNFALRNAIEEFLTKHPEIDRATFKMTAKASSVSWIQILGGSALFALGYLLGSKKSAEPDERKERRDARMLLPGFGA